MVFSCQTRPDIPEITPLVLKPIPGIDLTDDIKGTLTKKKLDSKIRQWAIDISDYLLELINQIEYRVPYIDLRKTDNTTDSK